MASQVKRLIEFISKAGSFKRGDLLNALGQKQTKALQHAIDKTLFALAAEGFITRSGNRYTARLVTQGTLRSSRSGGLYAVTSTGCKIQIEHSDATLAVNGADVSVAVTNIRGGSFIGRIVKHTGSPKKTFLAKFLRIEDKTAVYELTDMPPDVLVYAPLPQEGFAEAEITDANSLYAVTVAGTTAGRPACRITARLPLDDETCDLTRIAIKHGLPAVGEYPQVYSDDIFAQTAAAALSEKERKDYRKQRAVTIDGANSKDFDDAVFAQREGDNIRLFVHIADVSAFVNQNSQLDAQALARGNSFYLGKDVIPMLPEILCNDLCSLREREDRPAVSAEMLFNQDGDMLWSGFYISIIRVDKRLTYEEAETLITSKSKSQIAQTLRLLAGLTDALYRKRTADGKIDLNLPDANIEFSEDKVCDISLARRLTSHSLIEECMLSANQAAAKLLLKSNAAAVYRIHEKPDEDKIAALVRFSRLFGIAPKKGTASQTIQNIVQAACGTAFERTVNSAALQSMMQACYSPNPLGHFALGFADYLHFTSPIRRYADLDVHRCIKSLLSRDSAPPYSREEQEEISNKVSQQERLAKKAERSFVKLKSCRLMAERIGEDFNAYVSGISSRGFYVTLADKPIEGMVPLRLLTDDSYIVKEDDFTVVGKRFGKRYRLGDALRVQLISVDIVSLKIDFKPLGD